MILVGRPQMALRETARLASDTPTNRSLFELRGGERARNDLNRAEMLLTS
jgi:hypothetical protein